MKKIVTNAWFRGLIFWVIMFAYLLSSYWLRDDDKWYTVIYIGFKVFLQFVLSLVIIRLLIPFLLNKKKLFWFVISVLIAIYIMQTLYGIGRVYVFEVSNNNAAPEVGLVLIEEGKDGKNSKNHIKNAYVSKMVKHGKTESSKKVTLKKGTYKYFCPFNKTPQYTLLVE